MTDPSEWGKNVAALVKGFIGKAVDSLNARMDNIEHRLTSFPEQKDGKDGAPGERGLDGKDGVDGKDGKDGERGQNGVDGRDGDQGPQGEPGRDGKDAEPVTVAQIVEALRASPELIASAMSAYLAENPPASGKDGADGRDGKDAEPVSEEAIARAVASHIALNPPAPGRDGRDGLPGIKGEDGKDGKDGADGLGFDDLSVLDEGDGAALLKFSRGDSVKEFRLQLPRFADKGIHSIGHEYRKGDGVTFGGSFWIAQKDSPIGKPGEAGSDGWRLAVKRGRDGKDGAPGKDFVPAKPVKIA